MVHVDQSNRGVLACEPIPAAQEISQIRVSERELRVPSAPIWVSAKSKVLLPMRGSCSGPAEIERDQDPDVHRRLGYLRSVAGASVARYRDSSEARHRTWFHYQPVKEQPSSLTTSEFSGSQARFSVNDSQAIGRTSGVVSAVCDTIYIRSTSVVQAVPASPGADGIRSSCGPVRSVENESLPMLDIVPKTKPTTRLKSSGEGYSRVHGSIELLEGPCVSSGRVSVGSGVNAEGGVYRCQPDGLGRHTRRPDSEWSVVSGFTGLSHQLSGAHDGVPSATAFSTLYQRSPCVNPVRQHYGSGVCEPAGRDTLSPPAQIGREVVGVGQQSFLVNKGDACPRNTECGGGSVVTGESAVRRMAVAPRGGRTDMAETRQSRRRSLRIARKRPVSYVLLAKGRGCPTGRGRFGSPVAKRPAVCIPTTQSDNAHAEQSEGNGADSDFDSTTVAQGAVDGGDNAPPVCPSMAAPITHRPIISGEWRNLSPPSGQGGTLGLAREKLTLGMAGLPANVVATIQSARARSTRSLYDRKWRVFEKWCEERDVIPFQCSVALVLCFLQDMLEADRAFSTIKVYVAAISACHIGFGGKPVGQHPLVCRFMKGARRLRPVVRSVVPTWDLEVVLDALSKSPFEPLESVDLKILSLKTVLLLALASAK